MLRSGVINLTKSVDVTTLNIPLCNRCYQSINYLYEKSAGTNTDVSMETEDASVKSLVVVKHKRTIHVLLNFLVRRLLI